MPYLADLETSGIPTVLIDLAEENEKVKHDALIYGIPELRFVSASRRLPGPEDVDNIIGSIVQGLTRPLTNNVIDAAIALSSSVSLGKATPPGGYGTPMSTTATAPIGMPVMKYGRTTGLTHGQVYAIDATVNVRYSAGVARFVHQIVITPGTFSAGGDSGSLIVVDGTVDTRKPVGLLFAGSSSYTIANPIDDVLMNFGVTIDGN